MPLIIPNTIENDTPADAAELQQNFATIQAYTNTNTILRDGSVAMTNPLVLPGDPTQPNHAANMGYVDSKNVLYLPLTGGTVTGQIKGITPVDPVDLTRKDYCDLKLPLAGGTVTGQIKGIIPVAAEDLVRKDYVDAADTANSTASTTGLALKVAKSGDTMSGSLDVGTAGTALHHVQAGGNPSSDQPGVHIRGDGAIIGRLEDPSGLTSPNILLERAGPTVADATGIYMSFNRSAGTSGGTVNIGTIRIATGASGVDYNETSDYRVKDDLGPVKNAVERLLQLQPKRFRAKDSGVEQEGFMAHEVAPVVPNAVTGAKDGTELQQLAPMRLIPLLVAAVQQLTARVAELEAS